MDASIAVLGGLVVAMPTIGGYELHAVLGRGGTGVVYEARAPDGRRVAIKMLATALARDDTVRDRVRREAGVLRALHDAHCVELIDFVDDGDEAAIVLELVDGASLRAALGVQPHLPPADVVAVMRDLLDGLAAAHALDVLHRDVKPDNVLVDRRGSAKLADFGLARPRGDASQPPGAAEGTPAYMSPEQVRGEPLDARSDLYAAGCVLYELLTGAPVFPRGNPFAVLQAQLRDAPTLDALPSPLAHVAARALAKERDERFDDAREFRDALDDAARRSYAAPLLVATGTLAGVVAGLVSESSAHGRARPRARLRRVGRAQVLGGVAAAVVVTGVAIGVGASLGGGSKAHRAATPATTLPTAPPVASTTIAATTATAATTSTTTVSRVDPCLVGRWVLASPVIGGVVASFGAGSGNLLGGQGLVRTVSADGHEQYDYSTGAPYVSGPFRVVFTGSVRDELVARGGTETIVAHSGTSTVRSTITNHPPGATGVGTLPPFPNRSTVTYSCGAGGVTEHASGAAVVWRGG